MSASQLHEAHLQVEPTDQHFTSAEMLTKCVESTDGCDFVGMVSHQSVSTDTSA